MKRYNFKRFQLENSIDNTCPSSLRKYFNSAERSAAKRDVNKAIVSLKEDRDIRIRDIEGLHLALDRKYNQVRFDFARTLHKFGVPLVPGGEKTAFRNTYNWSDFDETWDYSGMSEEELLEALALTTKTDYVIDINLFLKHSPPWFHY